MGNDAAIALRSSAAWGELSHVSCVRVSGPSAFEAVDQICTTELYLRDTQLRPGLLLDDDGGIVADILVARDDEDYLLVAEGLDSAGMIGYIRDSTTADLRYELQDLSAARRFVSLSGPYSWEVLSEVLGPEVIGLPYLFMLRLQEGFCFRAGKTGEFGYDLLLDSHIAGELLERIGELASRFDAQEAKLEDFDQCALENWFFNIRREGRQPVTPLELQLQWRTSYQKQYRGAAAITERRTAGYGRRLTTLVAPEKVAPGDEVWLDDQIVGEVVNAGYSAVRGDWVGLALIDLPLASSGIADFRVGRGSTDLPVRTVSPPVINNRSLHISPQLHSYATRNEFTFPPLIPTNAPRG